MEHDTSHDAPDCSVPATWPGVRSATMSTPVRSRQTKRWCSLAAVLCFVSELIHLWLLPNQYATFIGYGIVFLVIAIAQGFIGAQLLFEPGRRLLTFGLWVNALIVVLYSFTHTIGVPVGLAFLPLPIDVWGGGAALISLMTILILWLLRRKIPRVRRHKRTRSVHAWKERRKK